MSYRAPKVSGGWLVRVLLISACVLPPLLLHSAPGVKLVVVDVDVGGLYLVNNCRQKNREQMSEGPCQVPGLASYG